MINKVELIVRRRLVREFIKADFVDVELTRRTGRTKTAGGGWTTVPAVPLPPQIARIIPSKRRFDNGLVNAEAGALPKSEYLLLGSHRMDVEVDDSFFWQGNYYKITGILPHREERTLCSMYYLGPENG
jgi:hypothetical protein